MWVLLKQRRPAGEGGRRFGARVQQQGERVADCQADPGRADDALERRIRLPPLCSPPSIIAVSIPGGELCQVALWEGQLEGSAFVGKEELVDVAPLQVLSVRVGIAAMPGPEVCDHS